MNDPIFQRSTNKSSNSSSHSHQHQHTDLSNGNNSHHPNHNFHLDMDQRQIYQRPSSARVRSSTTNNNSTGGSPQQQQMMKQRPLSARTRREHSHNYTSGGGGASTARSYDSYQRGGGGGGVCDCTGNHFNTWVPRPVKNHENHKVPLGPNTPGPGNYQPSYSLVETKAPTPAMATGRRFYSPPTTSSQTPGPNYDPKIQSDVHNPIGWRHSFGKADRFEKPNRPVSPGPGYKPQYTQVDGNVKGAAFLRESRSRDARTGVPGPGQYTVHDEPVSARAPVTAFGQEKRLVYSTSRVPGPGTYSVPAPKDTPAFSFGHSRKDSDFGAIPVSPGPGVYKPNYDVVFEYGGGVTFGTEKRGVTPRNNNPSAAEYNPRIDLTKEGAPAFSFGSSTARNLTTKNDGPGPIYNPDDSAVHTRSPGFSFPKAKNEHRVKQKSPGPKYNVSDSFKKVKEKQLAFGFGTSKRDQFKPSKTPGPADYNVQSKNGNGVPIGKDARFKYKHSTNPAPTAYNPRLPGDTQGPVSFGKQTRSSVSKSTTPGPADYRICDCYVRARSPGAVLYLTG